jgi:hypothetical protein
LSLLLEHYGTGEVNNGTTTCNDEEELLESEVGENTVLKSHVEGVTSQEVREENTVNLRRKVKFKFFLRVMCR